MKITKSDEQPWFAVRCLFHDVGASTYEERTILVAAASYEDAIAYAENEALLYADTVGLEYLKYLDTFHLFEKDIKSGTEIFSIMRTIDMPADEYIDHFLDSGNERRS